jgi:hypothetical protein
MQPGRPKRRRNVTQHRTTGRGPPDDVSNIRSNIDAGRDPAGTAPQANLVLEQQVKSAAPRPMSSGRWEPISMLCVPLGTAVTCVDIEHVNPGSLTGRNADQRSGMIAPQGVQEFSVAGRVLEAVRCRWTFIGRAREAWQALVGECERSQQVA